MTAVKVDSLTYTYGIGTPFEHKALDNVNIDIEEGSFTGIIGHTGSGKSTLMQHLNGLMKPTSGKVYIYGRDIWEKGTNIKEIRFKVGIVFQYPEYQLFEETVYKDISYGPHNMGLKEDEIDKRVHEALRFVGLNPDILEKSPFELSGGQKRRVAIAGVIAMQPQILVLDEPTAGLDPSGRDSILGNIREYHQTQKTTILLVSHSMEDISSNTSNVICLSNGKNLIHGSVHQVYEQAALLDSIGLSVPQITRVFTKLIERGIKSVSPVYTKEEAVKEILHLLSERGSN